MPMGMPGWPEFAACTASIASARMALASNAMSAGSLVVGGACVRVTCASGSGMVMDLGNARRRARLPHARTDGCKEVKLSPRHSILGNNSEFSRNRVRSPSPHRGERILANAFLRTQQRRDDRSRENATMDGIHLLGEWYGCAADSPEMTQRRSRCERCACSVPKRRE